MLLCDLSVVSVEANHVAGVVQHDIVAAEESIADQVSLLFRAVLAIDKEFASILSLRLVVGVDVGNLNIDGIITLLH